MTLDRHLAELIRCPACKAEFASVAGRASTEPAELTCTGCGLIYPITNGVPILLVDEARRG